MTSAMYRTASHEPYARTMMRGVRRSMASMSAQVAAVAAAFALLLAPATASAQSVIDAQRAAAPPAVTTIDVNAPNAAAGPVLYVCDAAGQLGTVTLGTYAVHRIGSTGTLLTDIGFNPKDHQLYGISFTEFYRVNTATGRATPIGSLGLSDANALVFDAGGKAYVEGVNHAQLYTVNLKTGRAATIGATRPFRSAGDLTFYNGALVLSGYYQSGLTGSTPDTLVQLNAANGAPTAYAELAVANLFGLVSTGKNLLFGFAGFGVYELFPNQPNIYKRAVLLHSIAGKGLAQIYGAAYNGNFQY